MESVFLVSGVWRGHPQSSAPHSQRTLRAARRVVACERARAEPLLAERRERHSTLEVRSRYPSGTLRGATAETQFSVFRSFFVYR